MTEDSLEMIMKMKHYRITPQRETVLSVFHENPGKHFSAEDVYRLLKKNRIRISKATVYRNLELFSEIGLIRRVDFGDGMARYELSDQSCHSHHHLICEQCGTVIPINIDWLDDLEKRIATSYAFEIHDHQLKFFGLCKNCRKAIQEKGDHCD
jgi:Fur family ferric uptake transcriptional regulator